MLFQTMMMMNISPCLLARFYALTSSLRVGGEKSSTSRLSFFSLFLPAIFSLPNLIVPLLLCCTFSSHLGFNQGKMFAANFNFLQIEVKSAWKKLFSQKAQVKRSMTIKARDIFARVRLKGDLIHSLREEKNTLFALSKIEIEWLNVFYTFRYLW